MSGSRLPSLAANSGWLGPAALASLSALRRNPGPLMPEPSPLCEREFLPSANQALEDLEVATGKPVTREFHHKVKGRDVVILNTIFPMRNTDGEIDRIGVVHKKHGMRVTNVDCHGVCQLFPRQGQGATVHGKSKRNVLPLELRFTHGNGHVVAGQLPRDNPALCFDF